MRLCIAAALATGVLLLSPIASAAPGAHGPGGEHLDAPAAVLSAGASVPRVEAKSELFELVARVEGGTLSILIDRYDTNQPVLEADVELEAGPHKHKARFRREQGDYAVTDPALVALVSSPGSHAIVFTVNAAKDSDLLEGTMQVAAQVRPGAAASLVPHASTAALLGGGLLVIGGAGALLRRRRVAHGPAFVGGRQ